MVDLALPLGIRPIRLEIDAVGYSVPPLKGRTITVLSHKHIHLQQSSSNKSHLARQNSAYRCTSVMRKAGKNPEKAKACSGIEPHWPTQMRIAFRRRPLCRRRADSRRPLTAEMGPKYPKIKSFLTHGFGGFLPTACRHGRACPGLSRPSTSCNKEDMDARQEAAGGRA